MLCKQKLGQPRVLQVMPHLLEAPNLPAQAGAVVLQLTMEPVLHSHVGERGILHNRRTQHRQLAGRQRGAALCLGRMEEVARDHEAQEGIAQELQRLVGVLVITKLRPAQR